VHEKRRKFECPTCHKRFAQHIDLARHVDAVHRGIKAFACPLCQKGFGYSSNLNKHVEAVHKDKVEVRRSKGQQAQFVMRETQAAIPMPMGASATISTGEHPRPTGWRAKKANEGMGIPAGAAAAAAALAGVGAGAGTGTGDAPSSA